MPKKKLNAAKEEEEIERKPQNITLGCFIKEAKPRGGKNKQVRNESACVEIEDESAERGLAEAALSPSSSTESGKHDESKDICEASAADVSERRSQVLFGEKDRHQEGFAVMRTKKGGFPIYLEKRAKGKKVTVVRQVTGDSKTLLHLLKSKFGTGGLIKPGEVEIQGDFEEKLTKYFKENTHLLVQYKPNA